MLKSVIKEIIILLLICLAIILVIGVLMYEYVPMSKVIPNEVSYSTPSDAKSEILTDDGVDESQVIKTYEVTQDDLNNYKRVNNYKPGKANPFAAPETVDGSTSSSASGTTSSGSGTTSNGGSTQSTGSATGTSSNGASTSSGSSTGMSTSSGSSSGGTYFPDKGTK